MYFSPLQTGMVVVILALKRGEYRCKPRKNHVQTRAFEPEFQPFFEAHFS
jgi:hypothetical protein